MSMTTTATSATATLTLDRFWRWLKEHHRCIVRAGGDDAFLYDAERLHWHLSEDPDRNLVVQLFEGKDLLAEIIIDPTSIVFVQAMPEGNDNQVVFELVASEGENYAAYHFVVAHGYDEAEQHASEAYKH